MSRALMAAMLALGGLVGTSSLSAQTVTTKPVGAISSTVAANNERRLGLTLARPSLYSAAASAVSANSVTVSTDVPSLATGSKYIVFTSGNATGQWLQVSSVSGAVLTLAGSPVDLGAAMGDKFEVRQFWTLNSLFPSGGGLPVSPDPSQPTSLILAYNPDAVGVNIAASTTFFYYDDPATNDSDGWYNFGTGEPAGDVVVSPETFFTIRNLSASATSLVYVGDVPAISLANAIVARVAGPQDNLIFNPYPSAITVGTAGLISSGAVRPSTDPSNPIDLVLAYPANGSGFNGAATTTLFYYDDPATNDSDGWYDFGTGEPAANFSIQPGAAFVIRKSGGTAQTPDWKPAVPYTL